VTPTLTEATPCVISGKFSENQIRWRRSAILLFPAPIVAGVISVSSHKANGKHAGYLALRPVIASAEREF
jgi:hypothetical protein